MFPLIVKRMSTYTVSCSLSKANPGRGIVRLAEPRIISVARGRKSAKGKESWRERKRERLRVRWTVEGTERIRAARSCLSSHVFAHTHSFVRQQRCSICDANPGRPPTSCVGRLGSYMGRVSRISYIHIRALVHAQQRLSRLAPTSVRTDRIISLRSSKNLCIM